MIRLPYRCLIDIEDQGSQLRPHRPDPLQRWPTGQACTNIPTGPPEGQATTALQPTRYPGPVSERLAGFAQCCLLLLAQEPHKDAMLVHPTPPRRGCSQNPEAYQLPSPASHGRRRPLFEWKEPSFARVFAYSLLIACQSPYTSIIAVASEPLSQAEEVRRRNSTRLAS